MSVYKDLICDFPTRCHRLLTHFHPYAERMDLEVTFLLAMAAAGITIPFERLRRDDYRSQEGRPHPESADAFRAETYRPLHDCEVWDSPSLRSWRYCIYKPGSTDSSDPGQWSLDTLPPRPLQVRKVLWILRTALSHGNVYTRGDDSIEELLFTARVAENDNTQGHECLRVAPADLRQFLEGWFAFLRKARTSSTKNSNVNALSD